MVFFRIPSTAQENGAQYDPTCFSKRDVRFGSFQYLNETQIQERKLEKQLRNIRSLVSKAHSGLKLDAQQRRKLAVVSEARITRQLQSLKTEDELLEAAF